MPGLDPFDVVPPGQLSKEEVAKLGEMMAGMPGGPGSGGAGGAGDAPPAMSSEQAGLPHTPSPPRGTGTVRKENTFLLINHRPQQTSQHVAR